MNTNWWGLLLFFCILIVGVPLLVIRESVVDVEDVVEVNVLRETLELLYAHESLSGKVVEGDSGFARGDFHIHKEFWQDGCEFWKVDWPYSDVYDKHKSEVVILGVWLRYCPNAVLTGNKELLLRYFHTPGKPYREDTSAYVQRLLK